MPDEVQVRIVTIFFANTNPIDIIDCDCVNIWEQGLGKFQEDKKTDKGGWWERVGAKSNGTWTKRRQIFKETIKYKQVHRIVIQFPVLG